MNVRTPRVLTAFVLTSVVAAGCGSGGGDHTSPAASTLTPSSSPTPTAIATESPNLVSSAPPPDTAVPARAWAAGLRFVGRSDDGGKTWRKVLNLGFAAALGVDFVDRNT